MKFRTRLKRATVGALAATVVIGAGAFADTSSVSITLGVVNGQRSLQVTGIDSSTGLPAGPAVLNFGPSSTSAPFGVLVTDVAYERAGYDVTATLSNLYRLNADGTSACADTSVASGGFSVDFASASTDGVEAVTEPFLTFIDTNINEDMTGLGLDTSLLTSTLGVTVSNVAGLIQHLTTDLTLMNVGQGTDGTAFTAAASHPDCSGGAADPSDVVLQTGAVNTPDLSALTASALAAAADPTAAGDTVLTPSEAIAAGMLPTGATQPESVVGAGDGGILWEATKDALFQLLKDAGITLLEADLNALTTEVIKDLYADSTDTVSPDLVLSLVGQTGVYANVPTLKLAPNAVGDASTGLYHGVMTVTVVDRPTA